MQRQKKRERQWRRDYSMSSTHGRQPAFILNHISLDKCHTSVFTELTIFVSEIL